jgi:predicted acetyltransferase
MASAIAIRRARPDELEAMAALSVLAFPFGPEDAQTRARRYRENSQLRGAERFIAERDGSRVGQFAALPFRFFLGGVAARAVGLASVVVAPEARRTGVARAMVRRHLADLRAQGAAWSVLYPFAARFYARLGWGTIAHRVRWRFAPSELPLFDERVRVERLSLDGAEAREELAACYARHCARTNGSLSRGAEQLEARWRADRALCAAVRPPGGGPLEGYLLAQLHAPAPRPQTLVVPELVAESGRAERALYGFLAAQAEQVDAIELDLPPGAPSAALAALLQRGAPRSEPAEAPEEHQRAGELWTGAMARLVDLSGALAARGWPARTSARVAFAAHDELVPDLAHPVTLFVEDGAAHVEPGHAPGAPLVRGPVGALSQLLAGAVTLGDAARLGLLTVEADGERAAGLAALDSLIALPPPYPLVTF